LEVSKKSILARLRAKELSSMREHGVGFRWELEPALRAAELPIRLSAFRPQTGLTGWHYQIHAYACSFTLTSAKRTFETSTWNCGAKARPSDQIGPPTKLEAI
jgi:hypothetical protein